jgi:hypothetical protein
MFNFSDSHSDFVGDFGSERFQWDLAELRQAQIHEDNPLNIRNNVFRAPSFFGMGFDDDYFKKEIEVDERRGRHNLMVILK